MMHWLGALYLLGSFAIFVRAFGLVEKSRKVVAVTGSSLALIRNPALDDEQKEAALRRDALLLFRLFFVLALGGAAALLVPAALIWSGDQFGVVSLEAVLRTTVSPTFLIGGTLLAFVVFSPRHRRRGGKSPYTSTERLLHRLAFGTRPAQVAVADLEDRLFAKELAPLETDRPVFITALPRAGTTLLLECCARLPEFATHSYRDMPFVLTPCLWSRFASRFRQNGEMKERAHGDGMQVSPDSPEAFEELLWMAFWRKHYRHDRIVPWQPENRDEFDDFLRNHMRKIIFLRRGPAAPARYLSKNNANIARVGYLRLLFPQALLIVPFRDPLQHAASLWRQHRRFKAIHAEDRFAADYMKGVGHFEFGANLRPIDFDGWLDRRTSEDPNGLPFWIEYWIVAYRSLLEGSGRRPVFLDFDALCRAPGPGLGAFGHAAQVRHAGAMAEAARAIRPPRPHEVDHGPIPPALLAQAAETHARLVRIAANRS